MAQATTALASVSRCSVCAIGARETALDAIWRPGHEYKKAGVTLVNLVPSCDVQGGLFDRPDDPRSVARMRAMDSLNARYGRGTVTFAAMGRQPGWKLRTDFISPRYTTNWGELMRV